MMRKAFTLVEMLVVIAIIGVIAAMSMAALLGAAEEGRRHRAKAQIAKLDQLINEKWNAYRFRQLPVRIANSTPQPAAARMRLDVMRELQRLELPDRMTDVYDAPVTGQPLPAVARAYQRYFNATAYATNSSYEGAECLYAIIAQMRDGDKSALSFFANSEIGDTDGDGALEILDPWDQPIMFLRWAPGYSKAMIDDVVVKGDATATPPTPDKPLSDFLSAPAPIPPAAVDTFQVPAGRIAPDTFDPLKVDPRWLPTSAEGFKPFRLRPLIFSGGPDKVYDIYTDDSMAAIHYSQTGSVFPFVANDPYHVKLVSGVNVWVGSPADYDGDGDQNGDNITNHGLDFDE